MAWSILLMNFFTYSDHLIWLANLYNWVYSLYDQILDDVLF